MTRANAGAASVVAAGIVVAIAVPAQPLRAQATAQSVTATARPGDAGTPNPERRRTAQQVFNEAQTAFDAGNWKDAVAGYQQALTVARPGLQSTGAIQARLACAEAKLAQWDSAARHAASALATFDRLGVARSEDLALAWLVVADDRRAKLEMDEAIEGYRRAMAAAEGPLAPGQRQWARLGISHAAMTQDPALAARMLDEELAAMATERDADKAGRRLVLAERALAELNRGDAKTAATFIRQAVSADGMGSRVSLADVSIRGNAALVYARLGHAEEVRRFLAFSGAGHVPDGNAVLPTDADLPVCGPDLRPDDVAVIEFAIGSDGHAAGTSPIYASRSGSVGTTFAQAVSHWRWSPDKLAKLNPFWRSAIRMELRCVKRPPGLQVADSYRQATIAWLDARNVRFAPEDAAAGSSATIDTPAAQALAGQISILTGRSSRQERRAASAALMPMLDRADAPIAVRAFLAYLQGDRGTSANRAMAGRQRAEELGEAVASISARADAGRAAAWLRLEQALALEQAGDFGAAGEMLHAIISVPTPVLPADDPVRNLATLHLAMLDKAAGREAQADERLRLAGIDAQQCSMLDVKPPIRQGTITSDAFPMEAMRWGFEGYARESFDIAADGHIEDVRTVIAYPPFVFGPTTEKAMASFRYLPPTLGGEVLGCTGQTMNVRYSLPK